MFSPVARKWIFINKKQNKHKIIINFVCLLTEDGDNLGETGLSL